MSLKDFHSSEETEYLTRNPENARRLKKAIAQLEAGKGLRRSLIPSGALTPGKTTSGSRKTSQRSKRGSIVSSKKSRQRLSGIGKPEPLKHEYPGYLSRRTGEKQRLVYQVRDDIRNGAAC